MHAGTDWKEDVAPDEDARFADLARRMVAIQTRADGRYGKGRALHRKQLAGLRATFTVVDDLPDALRVGPFTPGARFDAWVRLSNGGPFRLPDSEPDIRGVAIKLLGVPGKKVLGEHATQDFLLIQRRVQPADTADAFVEFAEIAFTPPQWSLPYRLVRHFGIVETFRIFRGFLAVMRPPVGSIATQRFYTASPLRWGATAVRAAIVPVDETPARPPTTPDGHTTDIVRRLKEGPIAYDFLVQCFHSEDTTPIEHVSVDWPDAVSPFVRVARLEWPQQDLEAPDAVALADQIAAVSFDPWHALEELRPLGQVMRARKHAYYASQQQRGCAPEPG